MPILIFILILIGALLLAIFVIIRWLNKSEPGDLLGIIFSGMIVIGFYSFSGMGTDDLDIKNMQITPQTKGLFEIHSKSFSTVSLTGVVHNKSENCSLESFDIQATFYRLSDSDKTGISQSSKTIKLMVPPGQVREIKDYLSFDAPIHIAESSFWNYFGWFYKITGTSSRGKNGLGSFLLCSF